MKNLLFLTLFTHLFFAASSQGLENVIIEKYYISDSDDIVADKIGGRLPVGSVTYRIYIDMLPEYKFQAVFGIPGHELKIATTTSFFNNEDRGSFISTTIPFRNVQDNTVILDSYLTAGAACEGHWGILKEEDNNDNTVINKNGILKNEDKRAGIPLTKRDGLMEGNPPRITFFGIDSLAEIFNNKNVRKTSQLFSTYNGSWATLEGVSGPTAANRILIAQITTDGILTFELNVQIAKPGMESERYVARNPAGNEILFPALLYKSDGKAN
jgi:hypothetical protein